MHPIPWPVLDTGLYAFHGTLREEVFQILQLSGVCGHGLEPCTLSTQLILPRSTTQITSVYQFATAHHALIYLPDIYVGNILAQYTKPFGFHKPPFITLKNPLVFRNIHLTTDNTFLKCSSAFTYPLPIFCLQGLCRDGLFNVNHIHTNTG